MDLICSAEEINHNNVGEISGYKMRPELVKIKLNWLAASFIASSGIILTLYQNRSLETPPLHFMRSFILIHNVVEY